MHNFESKRPAIFLLGFLAVSACTQVDDETQLTGHLVCEAEPSRIALPGGEFRMGAEDGYLEERPTRMTEVSAFEIDTLEVTNAAFAEFVEDTGYVTTAEKAPDPALHPNIPEESLIPGSAVFVSPLVSGQRSWWQFTPGANWRAPEGPGSSLEGRMDHPVVHVSYNDAAAYADWADGDLPTEEEWEYAARGGLHGARYAWGDEPPHTGPVKANTWQGMFPVENTETDGFVGTAPGGCFDANGYGLFDMTGNVWEWTQGQYDPRSENSGLIKGGSYLCSDNFCQRFRPAARQPQDRDFSTSHIGFRLVYRPTEDVSDESDT